MFQVLSSVKNTSFAVIFLVVFVLNAMSWQEPAVGGVLLGVYLVWLGSQLGRAIAPREDGYVRAAFGIWALCSLVAILGAGAYYAASYTEPVAVTIAITLIPLVFLISAKQAHDHPIHNAVAGEEHRVSPSVWIAIGLAVLCLTLTMLLVSEAATEEAIRSAWERVPTGVFLTFGSAAIVLSALLLRGRERAAILPLFAAFLFTLLSVALFVFPLGYGFDPFIHRATVEHIAEFGTITPKPFYYIGQYALILFANLGFSIPIDIADRLLVPLLTSLLLPAAWYAAAVHLAGEKRAAMSSLLALFLLPLSSFIVTTPQGLANLWTFLVLFVAIPRLLGESWPVWPLVLGTLATVAIHPIAGIPVLLFLTLVCADPRDPRQRFPRLARLFSAFVILGGSVILPAAFVVNASISGADLTVDWAALSPVRFIESMRLDLFFENRFSAVLDFVYLFAYNQALIIVLGVLHVLWHERKRIAPLRFHLALAIMLLVNYVVMSSAVQFTFLIDYERSNYADRLIPLALFALSPFLMLGAARASDRLRHGPVVLRAGAIVLAAAVLTSTFYLAYPRRDNYETSHGFNVSRADIDAVLAVEEDAAGMEYVVLANQTVASAAIREFGFAHYYGDLFYYPIPTGGPLYQQFLSMNERPNLETILTSMDLANVDLAYYLVNDYWWQSDRLIETAKTITPDWWAVGDGAVHIFRFERE